MQTDDEMTDESPLLIGGFYRLPDGQVVRTYGWDGHARQVLYYFDGDPAFMRRTVAEKIVRRDWTMLEIADFPNALDPILPYEFDLNWDLKTRSALAWHLATKPHDPDLAEAIARHGIDPDKLEAEAPAP